VSWPPPWRERRKGGRNTASFEIAVLARPAPEIFEICA
jgi:hypothetical protein